MKKDLKYYLPLGGAFILIVTLGIITKQSFIKLLPALVTLGVNLMVARVNRAAFLIGATNCILYSIGYFQEGLYGSAGSALLYSLPLQLVSYFTWRKNKYGSARVIKTLGAVGRTVTAVSLVGMSLGAAFVLTKISSSSQPMLDGAVFVLGLFATVYIMLGYIEGVVVNVISVTVSVTMWLTIVLSGKTENITYVVLNLYNLYMIILSLVNWIRLYKKQRSEREVKT